DHWMCIVLPATCWLHSSRAPGYGENPFGASANAAAERVTRISSGFTPRSSHSALNALIGYVSSSFHRLMVCEMPSQLKNSASHTVNPSTLTMNDRDPESSVRISRTELLVTTDRPVESSLVATDASNGSFASTSVSLPLTPAPAMNRST